MIIYNRNKEGKIDKTSTTFVESQKTVNATVNEFLEGTDLQNKISYLEIENLNNQLALVEVFELVILSTSNAKAMRLGGNKMVTVYVSLIIKGAKKFSDVPETIKPLVKAELETLGLGHLAQ